MKKAILILFTLCLTTVSPVSAQKGFDPARWQAEMEQFIVTEAGLTPVEASRFFPVYRQWKKKERLNFQQRRLYRHIDINNARTCAATIRKMDQLDIELKKLQQVYHQKFLRILPAGKVFQIIRAEDKFHRQAFEKFAARGGGDRD